MAKALQVRDGGVVITDLEMVQGRYLRFGWSNGDDNSKGPMTSEDNDKSRSDD